MLLTTGPLGGGVIAAAPASQPDDASLEGGSAQKNGCEYSSWTVRPSNQALVNPMLLQADPPVLQGSEAVVCDLDAIAVPSISPDTVMAVANKRTPALQGLARK